MVVDRRRDVSIKLGAIMMLLGRFIRHSTLNEKEKRKQEVKVDLPKTDFSLTSRHVLNCSIIGWKRESVLLDKKPNSFGSIAFHFVVSCRILFIVLKPVTKSFQSLFH